MPPPSQSSLTLTVYFSFPSGSCLYLGLWRRFVLNESPHTHPRFLERAAFRPSSSMQAEGCALQIPCWLSIRRKDAVCGPCPPVSLSLGQCTPWGGNSPTRVPALCRCLGGSCSGRSGGMVPVLGEHLSRKNRADTQNMAVGKHTYTLQGCRYS